MGEARLLWEIGAEGRDVRSLRTQLGLDSGYLSRLLRALETAGLVTVGPKDSDKRVRIARLTSAGSAERAVLDRRSDELAASLLAPLNTRQRDRLVAAMSAVERLLTASMVEIAPMDPSDPHARYCVHEYFAELDRRFDTGFDPALSIPADDHELLPPAGLFLVASLQGDPIGCGALKFTTTSPPTSSACGLPSPRAASASGADSSANSRTAPAKTAPVPFGSETNKTLTEAISLYRSAGYREVDPFNDEPYAHHWFEKKLRPSRLRGRVS